MLAVQCPLMLKFAEVKKLPNVISQSYIGNSFQNQEDLVKAYILYQFIIMTFDKYFIQNEYFNAT